MVRTVTSTLVVLLCCTHIAAAGDSLIKEFARTFAGRWVCETEADDEVTGVWSKGDRLRFVIVRVPTGDQSGVRYELQVEKDSRVVLNVCGITAWDPGKNCLRTVGFAAPGFLVESAVTKNGDKWIDRSAVTFPDGSTGTATATIQFSADGKEHTNVVSSRVDHKGQQMPDLSRVWKKRSKNHEILEEHLGWLIGTWTASVDTSEQGLVDVEGTFNWIADGDVIALNLRIGKWEGLSMIFFDTSDGQVKMWGANSQGGNGQAVLRVKGNELIWTNTVFDGNGKKRVSDFSYVKNDDKTMYVKSVDEVNGQEKQVLNTKK